MERLGADASWDDVSGILDLRMPESTRRGLLASRAFFPWGADHVYAAFERIDDDGWVSIPMRGREAVIGPLHPFLSACSSLLLSVEGMTPSGPLGDGDGLLGRSETQPRWFWRAGGAETAAEVDSIVLDALGSGVQREWELSSDGSRTAFRSE